MPPALTCQNMSVNRGKLQEEPNDPILILITEIMHFVELRDLLIFSSTDINRHVDIFHKTAVE